MGTEPDFPYSKKPVEPAHDEVQAPPPMPHAEPPNPPPPPYSNPTQNKLTCPHCGKVFTTKEELTMHMETVHTSPKKKV